MAKEKNDGREKGGCFGKLFGLIFLMSVIGLGTALYSISQPQDLTDLGGNEVAATTAASPPRDMGAVLSKSIEGDYSVTLTEKELNEWLARELKLKQNGELAQWVSMKRVWVRLRENVAEVIIEREISGHSFTTSMFLQVEQTESNKGITTQVHLHGGGFRESLPRPLRGGRFGKLTVPQGFLILVMPEFRKLATLFEKEIELGFTRMARIRIENKRLMLDPKQPTREAGAPDKTF